MLLSFSWLEFDRVVARRKRIMNEVTALGYVVVTASDLGAWATFAEDCLGLQVAPGPDGGTDRETLFLRTDERSWRLAVEEGDNAGLVALGFEVNSNQGLTS